MRHVVLLGLVLPFVAGCFQADVHPASPRPPPAPLTDEQMADVSAVRKQADAIIKVGGRIRDTTRAADTQATAEQSMAFAQAAKADLGSNDGAHPTWLISAHQDIGSAEHVLLSLETADASTCADEDLRAALATACAKVIAAATDPARPEARAERAKAAEATALQAIHLVGSEDERHTAAVYASCINGDACFDAAEKEAHRMGAHAGLAWLFSRVQNPDEKQVVIAEKYAAMALEEAKRIAATNAENQRQLDAEAQPISDAGIACAAHEAECKARCEKGEPLFCLSWAVRLNNAKPPKFAEARAYFQKACDQHVQHACTSLPVIDKLTEDDANEKDKLWDAVKQSGDLLAGTRWDRAVLDKYSSGTKEYAGKVRDFVNYERAFLDEHYCPSRRQFIAKAGLAEFTKRTTAHCKDDPPRGDAYSGGQVEIPAQCRSAYATPCP